MGVVANVRTGLSRAVRAAPPEPLPPPRLRRYQSVWRYGAAIFVGLLVWSSYAEKQADHAEWLFFLDPALGLIALVLMRYRRRWPSPIALVVAAMTAVSSSAVGPLLVVGVSMSARRRWREIIPFYLVAALPTAWLSNQIQPDPSESALTTIVVGVIATAAIVAVGMYIGARRDLIASLQDRAERAEREQTLRVSQAQATERTRIAREMHDVLAHRISRVAMHAGGLAYRTDLTPEQTREVAETIQTNAHEALRELRSVLGLLRTTELDAIAAEPPQPTLADLDELLEEARRNGMKVTVQSDLDGQDDLAASVGRSAYRVVQEGLTNAGKHAPNTAVTVRLRHTPEDELAVEVRNPLPIGHVKAPPGSGLGLVGLAERAALAGGRLEHETTGAGDFVVRAWLPWTRS